MGGVATPEWRKQRIGHALDEPYEPFDDRVCHARYQKRAAEADEAAGQHVGGIVRTDKNAASPDDHRRTFSTTVAEL